MVRKAFNLIVTLKSRTYTVTLYSSAVKYTTPLQKVTGGIGLEVKTGACKKTKLSTLI